MDTPSTAATEPTVAASRAAHAEALKSKQRAERATEPKAAKLPARPARPTASAPDARLVALVAWRDVNAKAIPAEVLEVVDVAIARGSRMPRSASAVEKADPNVVKAYFESTGLNRKELAAVLSISSSVIATVQNPNGDRWSAARFERAKTTIAAHLAAAAKSAPKAKAAKS
jgi:hypothetical protein